MKRSSVSPAARLLGKSLLAVLCGAAACGDGEPGSHAPVGELGSNGGAAATAGGASGSAGASSGVGGAANGGVGGTKPTEGGASGTTAGGAGGTSPGGSGGFSCVDAQPVIIDGFANGMARCADGGLVRVGPAACRLADLAANPACLVAGAGGATGGAAGADGSPRCADPCIDGPHGRPRRYDTGALSGFFACEYFCETDTDCPAGLACACDETGVGKCARAGCTTSDGCGAGEACRLGAVVREHCGTVDPALLCAGLGDSCVRNADCFPGGTEKFRDRGGCAATTVNDTLRCLGGAGCGRPILVGEIARIAALHRTDAWC